MKVNKIRIRECKALAREHLLGNYTLVIGAGILAVIIPVALLALSAVSFVFALHGSDMIESLSAYRTEVVMAGALLFTAFLMLGVVTAIFCGYGVTKLYINICRGDRYGISDIFYPFRGGSHPWRVVGVKLVLWIIMAVGMAIILAVGVLPGIFPEGEMFGTVTLVCRILTAVAVLVYLNIYLSLYLSDLVIIDRPGTGVFEALERSSELMKGHKLKGFWFIFFSFIFWKLLISVCSIAALWVIPYMACTRIFFYISAEGTLYRWCFPDGTIGGEGSFCEPVEEGAGQESHEESGTCAEDGAAVADEIKQARSGADGEAGVETAVVAAGEEAEDAADGTDKAAEKETDAEGAVSAAEPADEESTGEAGEARASAEETEEPESSYPTREIPQ